MKHIVQSVLAVALGAYALQTTAFGWVEFRLPESGPYYSADFDTDRTGWAFGRGSPVYFDGNAWTVDEAMASWAGVIVDVSIVDDGGWAVGQRAILYLERGQWKSYDIAYDAKESDNLLGVDALDSKNACIVGVEESGLWASDPYYGLATCLIDGTWIAPWRPESSAYYDIEMLSPRDVWAVGAGVAHWNGQEWSDVNGPFDDALVHGISMVSPVSGWMVGSTGAGSRGVVWHWDGNSWEEQIQTDSPLYSISMVDETDGWIVGGDWIAGTAATSMTILRYRQGEWIVMDPPSSVPGVFVEARQGSVWMFSGGPVPSKTNIDLASRVHRGQNLEPAPIDLEPTPTRVMATTPATPQASITTALPENSGSGADWFNLDLVSLWEPYIGVSVPVCASILFLVVAFALWTNKRKKRE